MELGSLWYNVIMLQPITTDTSDFENLVRSVDGTAGFALFLFERRMLNILDALKDGPLRRE